MTLLKKLAIIATVNVCAAADLPSLPADLEGQFERASVSEYGDFTVEGKPADDLVNFLTSHWRDLLQDANKIEDPDELARVASKIGAAAEQLPPLEYLNFLEGYMDLYEARRFPDMTFAVQLCGRGRKESFLSVNFEHPQVQILLERAKQLLPKDDEVVQTMIQKMASGKLADNYLTNVSDDAPLPETLPGIKLRKPWASLLDKIKPGERPHPADRRPGIGDGSGNGSVSGSISGAGAEVQNQPPRGILAGAILLLIGAIYFLFSQKAKAARKRRS